MAKHKHKSTALSTEVLSRDVRVVNIAPRVAPEHFNKLGWFKKLSDDEKDEVKESTDKLATALLNVGRSKLAVGEQLTHLQKVLKRTNSFVKYLRNFHLNERTAYRYISGYQNAAKILPPAVIDAAMVRGINILGEDGGTPLGKYTQAVKKLPAPKNPSPEAADKWLTEIEAIKRQSRASGKQAEEPEPQVPKDPTTLLEVSFRTVMSAYRRLPNRSTTKHNWIERLIGMILTETGSTQKSFSPANVPDDFKTGRGRPRTIDVEAQVAAVQ